MKLPVTPLAPPQIYVFGVLPLLVGVWLWGAYGLLAGLLPILLAAFTFSFFRDPERVVPGGEGLLVAPADGTVAAVDVCDEPQYLKARAKRVGIFLSVFDVHVNRAPEAGVVEYVRHTPGCFLDARDPRCSAENEANAIGIRTDDGRKLLVRQVAGLIARRIVCTVKEGDRVQRGERIGMIKFGSYTELLVEHDSGYEPAVGLKEKPKGGLTVLFRRVTSTATAGTSTAGPKA